MTLDELWAEFWDTPGARFVDYVPRMNAADPVDGSHASAVAPAPLWWLGVAAKMDAFREARQQVKLAA